MSRTSLSKTVAHMLFQDRLHTAARTAPDRSDTYLEPASND
jgi:hypothetical protein